MQWLTDIWDVKGEIIRKVEVDWLTVGVVICYNPIVAKQLHI